MRKGSDAIIKDTNKEKEAGISDISLNKFDF